MKTRSVGTMMNYTQSNRGIGFTLCVCCLQRYVLNTKPALIVILHSNMDGFIYGQQKLYTMDQKQGGATIVLCKIFIFIRGEEMLRKFLSLTLIAFMYLTLTACSNHQSDLQFDITVDTTVDTTTGTVKSDSEIRTAKYDFEIFLKLL